MHTFGLILSFASLYLFYSSQWPRYVVFVTELAVIIGKPGLKISKEDAFNHIFG